MWDPTLTPGSVGTELNCRGTGRSVRGAETWRQKYRECESRGKHSTFPPDEREAGRTDAVTGETDARRTLRSRGRGGGVSPGAAEVAPEQGVGDAVRL